MKDNVLDFDDEKSHAFMHACILVHARVPEMYTSQKRDIFYHRSPSHYLS